MKNILKTLMIAMALFILYNSLLMLPRIQSLKIVSQSQWDANIDKAETLAANKAVPKCVVVGSSLAGKLVFDDDTKAYYNLALAGDSSMTGLEAIVGLNISPRIVLIETNFIAKPANQAIVALASSRFHLQLVKYVPSFRVRFKPATLLSNLGRSMVTTVQSGDRPNLTQPAPVNRELFRESLALQVDAFRSAPKREELIAAIDRLAKLVGTLEGRGSRCIFLQMPVDRSLIGLPLNQVTQQYLDARFPPSRYPRFDPAGTDNYKTTDGLHMDREEAERCTLALKKLMDRLPSPLATTP